MVILGSHWLSLVILGYPWLAPVQIYVICLAAVQLLSALYQLSYGYFVRVPALVQISATPIEEYNNTMSNSL